MKVISGESSPDNLVTNGMAGAVVLYSTKSTISILLRALSFAFRHSLDFIQVKDAEGGSGLAGVFGVSEVPALGLLRNGELLQYQGDLKSFSDITAWISETTGLTSASSEKKASASTDSAGNVGSTDGTSPAEVLSAASLDALFAEGLSQYGDDVFAYVVGVVPSDSPTGGLDWWNSLVPKCFGAVKCVQLKCADR